jgi:hypothetical protein
MRDLDPAHAREIQGILDRIEFREYSMEDPNPRPIGDPAASAVLASANP